MMLVVMMTTTGVVGVWLEHLIKFRPNMCAFSCELHGELLLY